MTYRCPPPPKPDASPSCFCAERLREQAGILGTGEAVSSGRKALPLKGGPGSTNKLSRCRHRLLLVSPYVSREPTPAQGGKQNPAARRVHFAGQEASYPGATVPVSLTKPAVRLLSSFRVQASLVKSRRSPRFSQLHFSFICPE